MRPEIKTLIASQKCLTIDDAYNAALRIERDFREVQSRLTTTPSIVRMTAVGSNGSISTNSLPTLHLLLLLLFLSWHTQNHLC